MAVISCKMCGGELEIAEGALIAKCRYCGTKQTVPKLDNEKKVTLFSRANRLRFNSEFDKASGVYESIVAEFPEEAEAYWGLVLCKYGIEYVDDPATSAKIPTCHRTSFTSVFEDTDFEQTLENADPATRAVYRDEAKKIEELRQGIVEVSSMEEPYDIFICYKETDINGNRTIDSVIAQDVYTALTDKGYRVFFSRISLEDKLGREYEPYIFAALNSAKIMLAFGTDYEYYNAVWVKNEWSRFIRLMATDRTKTLIPCYKGIDAYDMPKEFLKLQSQDMGKVGAIQDLLRGIEKILPKKKPEIKTEVKTVEKVVVKGKDGVDTGSLLRRAEIFLEDGDFWNSNSYAEKVLDILPECVEAYLIKLCCDLKIKSHKELGKQTKSFAENPNYKKILRFADDSLKEELSGYLSPIEETIKAMLVAEEKRIAEEKAAEEKRLAEERAVEEKAKEEKRKAEKKIKAAENKKIIEREKFKELKKKYPSLNSVLSKIISKRHCHAVGLKSDGTVVAAYNPYSSSAKLACDVSSWHDIIAVSTGWDNTVGLHSNGTVVAVGDNKKGQCNVSKWRNIIAVATGAYHTVGLKSDGTVVAVGYNKYGQCNVSKWRDIVEIAAGHHHTVGLKKDGTVVAVGHNLYKQSDLSNWHNIVAVSADGYHTVGLKSDGMVVAVGNNEREACNVSFWRNIVAVSAGWGHTIGLKLDGTCVTTSNYSLTWQNIIAVSNYGGIGLKLDGTVEGVSDGGEHWKLFNSVDELEKMFIMTNEKRKKALNEEKVKIQQELENLKGVFSGKRRKEIEARLAEIDLQLK